MSNKVLKNFHIATERLLIRNLKSSDLDAFHLYRSNPEVTKYQGFDLMSMEQAAQFIQDQKDRLFGNAGEWVQYGIENNAAHIIVGDCAIRLTREDIRIAEIGITITPSEQRKGYAKEALRGIMEFLFNRQKIHRIVEIVDVDNIASINLLRSAGFKQEGHFIENIFFKGKWGSEFQYALLKREWDMQDQNKTA